MLKHLTYEITFNGYQEVDDDYRAQIEAANQDLETLREEAEEIIRRELTTFLVGNPADKSWKSYELNIQITQEEV